MPLSQDFNEFYNDPNWGIRDYPLEHFKEPIYKSEAGQTQPQAQQQTQPTVQTQIQPLMAGFFEKIPTWGWIAIAIGAYFLFRRR